jgi:hypothetical protein
MNRQQYIPLPCCIRLRLLYRGERVTGLALCYVVERTVSPVCISSPVRSIPATRICRARMGIKPGRREPAQRSWSPVYLHGPGYPAPTLRTMSLHSPVRPVPAPCICRASITIQPGRVVSALHSRPPVRLPSPIPPVPTPRTRLPVRLQGPQYSLFLLLALALRCVSPARYHPCRHHAPGL